MQPNHQRAESCGLPPVQERFFNRELSWLSFNRRVLAEAVNPDYPLLERLRFLSISGSNLDEFMMVRVAGIAGQVRRQIDELSIDGKTPTQQLGGLLDAVKDLIDAQQEVLVGLSQDLAKAGIRLIDNDPFTRAEADWLRAYFEEHVVPILTPQAVDPAHPFPFIANQGTGILFQMQRLADSAGVSEMILIPPSLPRFVRLPGVGASWIGIEELVRRHAALIFPGFRVLGHGTFRVLRDSDIEIEEDAEDLVRYYRTAIQRRRRGKVIMLQLQDNFDPDAERLLRDQLRLDHALVIKSKGLLAINGLATVVDEDRQELKFDPKPILDNMGSEAVTKVIAANHALGDTMQISGTPTFVVDKIMLRGYVPLADMRQIVAEQRKDG